MGRRPRDQATIVRSERNLWRAGAFGVVVLGPASERPVTLDGTGVAIWDALASPRSRGEVVALMARAFSTEPARIADDVDRLLDALEERGIIRVAVP